MAIQPFDGIWDPGRELAVYEPEIGELFVDAAKVIREELRTQYLEVILIEAPEKMHHSHKVRVAVGNNPEWYRQLWNDHSYNRMSKRRRGKAASRVKRRRVSKSLDSIVHQKDKPYVERRNGVVRHSNYYVSLMRDILFSRLTEGFSYREHLDAPTVEMPPDALAVWYFQRSLPPEALTDEIREAAFELLPRDDDGVGELEF